MASARPPRPRSGESTGRPSTFITRPSVAGPTGSRGDLPAEILRAFPAAARRRLHRHVARGSREVLSILGVMSIEDASGQVSPVMRTVVDFGELPLELDVDHRADDAL